ncbi:MAG: germination protein Ger(x)C family [Paenibacillaceae bacterium]|jgi:spore germination protein KC|nr:germination protein Ger(x)C family [Paenibacillaceae bacterium]
MTRAGKLCLALLLTISGTTGCWNLKEPDQLAFVLGTGLDLTKDGQLQISLQVAIPSGAGGGQESGGGTKKQSFLVLSTTGKNVYDAFPKLQAQLSRNMFFGHRRIILIGQRLAEHGIDNQLDVFLRHPQAELRSKLYIVKNGQAKDILSAESIFEPFSATELFHEQATLGLKSNYIWNILSDALCPGLQPMLPAVELTDPNQIVYMGSALFNKQEGLKLSGFLDAKESFYANWITGKITDYTLTYFVKQGNGTVSLKLHSLGRRIRVKRMDKQRIKIDVLLSGAGDIAENNTNLDPTKRQDFQIIQDELRDSTRKSVQQLIEKVQKQCKTDIFGFGESVHQQYPSMWKTLGHDWNDTFPKLDVSVRDDLRFKHSGETNSSVKSML